jgi:hypothetical protein
VEVGADAINFILIFFKYFIRCLNIFHVINIGSFKIANKMFRVGKNGPQI